MKTVPPRTDKISHTGTGRFAWLTMRPMTLWESGDSNGSVSLQQMFRNSSESPATRVIFKSLNL